MIHSSSIHTKNIYNCCVYEKLFYDPLYHNRLHILTHFEKKQYVYKLILYHMRHEHLNLCLCIRTSLVCFTFKFIH